MCKCERKQFLPEKPCGLSYKEIHEEHNWRDSSGSPYDLGVLSTCPGVKSEKQLKKNQKRWAEAYPNENTDWMTVL